MFCEKCGKEINEGAMFCKHCGAKVDDFVPEDAGKIVTEGADVTDTTVETPTPTSAMVTPEPELAVVHTAPPAPSEPSAPPTPSEPSGPPAPSEPPTPPAPQTPSGMPMQSYVQGGSIASVLPQQNKKNGRKKIAIIIAAVILIVTMAVLGFLFDKNFFGGGSETPQKPQLEVTWQEKYDAAVKYLSEGKYEEAIAAFDEAIKIDEKKAEAYEGRGNVYLKAGGADNADKAGADFEKALELDSTLSKSWLALASIYEANGDLEKTLETLKTGREKAGEPGELEEIIKRIEPEVRKARRDQWRVIKTVSKVADSGVDGTEEAYTDTQSYVYDKDGYLKEINGVSDHGKNYRAYTYDSLGRVIEYDFFFESEEYADGMVFTYSYDDKNREIGGTGNGLGSDDKWTVSYDKNGWCESASVTALTDEVFLKIKYEHDGKGNLVKKTATLQSTGATHVWTCQYDKDGNAVKTTGYNGTTTEMTYDEYGQKVKEVIKYVNGVTSTTTFKYDADGKLISEKSVSIGSEYTNKTETTYEYENLPQKGKEYVENKLDVFSEKLDLPQ